MPGRYGAKSQTWSTGGGSGGNSLNGFIDFCTENGSSQCQNLALTGLCVPASLGSVAAGVVNQQRGACHTVDYDPSIKSQLASRNLLEGLLWCKFSRYFCAKGTPKFLQTQIHRGKSGRLRCRTDRSNAISCAYPVTSLSIVCEQSFQTLPTLKGGGRRTQGKR